MNLEDFDWKEKQKWNQYSLEFVAKKTWISCFFDYEFVNYSNGMVNYVRK